MPIDPFDEESLEVRFEHWLPMVQYATTWNGWSEQETLLQPEGHLHKHTYQEWNLLNDRDKQTLTGHSKAIVV